MVDTVGRLPIPEKLRRDVPADGITDEMFGKTVLGILNQASFPGDAAERVIELKGIAHLLELGHLVLCVNSG